MPNKTIFFRKENLDFADAQPGGRGPFINQLIEEARGISETPTSEKAPLGNFKTITPKPFKVPIEGKHAPIRPDRPTCRTCGMNLNKFGNCSNLSCKKHL